jgi:L-fuculose-phosphate aldolase
MPVDLHQTRPGTAPWASLTSQAELALVARMLHRQGYDDPLAGHITCLEHDGSILVNPFELSWDETKASDVVRINPDGEVIEGRWSVTPAIRLHLEVYRIRPDVRAIVHNHPRWATIWADCHRIPPIYDQTSALAVDHIALYGEYNTDVVDADESQRAAAALGAAAMMLLANHGVLVVADDLRHAYHRATILEQRSQRAWHVEALGGGVQLAPAVSTAIASGADGGSRWPGLFVAMARREHRADPSVLD